jgi:hypothetical protein
MINFSFMSRLFLLGLILFVGLIATPDVTMAQGIVSCDGFNVECTACNLVEMANLGIKILFGAVGLIFAIVMMKAGFGLITSGGNTAALNAAKSAFQNALIGLLIVMAAWLIVDLLMRTLLKGDGDLGAAGFTGWGPWSQVQCQDPAETKPFVDINTGHGGTPTVTGQGQVPGTTASGTCSIPPLTEMTDPLAISMEKGNAIIFNNPTLQQCATKFVAAVGGSAKINSAYRPPQYQQHFWELRDRWCTQGLRANSDPSCSAFKSAVSAEINKHFGSDWQCGAVGKTSRHTQNTAVDIGGIPNHSDPSVQAKAAANCLIWKNYPGDAVHYDLKPGCTCS